MTWRRGHNWIACSLCHPWQIRRAYCKQTTLTIASRWCTKLGYENAGPAICFCLLPACHVLNRQLKAASYSQNVWGPDSSPYMEQVHMDEIDLQEQVGKGGFGTVYKGTWRGAIVAVKHAICNVEDAESLEQSIREVVLSKKLSHPNVVQTYAWTVLTGPDAAGAVSLQPFAYFLYCFHVHSTEISRAWFLLRRLRFLTEMLVKGV